MTPAEAAYVRAFAQGGETIIVRRYAGTDPATRTRTDISVRGRVRGGDADDQAGLAQQATKTVMLLACDLEGASILPLRKSDRIVIGGREYAMETPDLDTRRIAGATLAYVVKVKG